MPVRSPVAETHVFKAESDDEENHRNFDNNNRRIEAGALLNTDDENGCNNERYDESGQVEADLMPEDGGGTQENMSFLQQFRRLRCNDVSYFRQIRLRATHE